VLSDDDDDEKSPSSNSGRRKKPRHGRRSEEGGQSIEEDEEEEEENEDDEDKEEEDAEGIEEDEDESAQESSHATCTTDSITADFGLSTLQRQSSGTSVFRDYLRIQLEEGGVLTTEQHNFLVLTDYKMGASFECPVCYDSFGLEGIFALSGCQHYLCNVCMQSHILCKVNDQQSNHLTCPMPECHQPIDQAQVKRSIPPDQYQRYLNFLFEDSLKKDPNCRWCPRPGCGTPMIGEPNSTMMRCPREDCNFCFCYNCKEDWHQDFTCQQYQEWKLENNDAEKRFKAWAEKNTKQCPSCRVRIQKHDGCNHMKCSSCRHEFCWLCMESVLGPDGKYKSGHWALRPSHPCYEKMRT